MTSIYSILAAFAIILIDLFARAGLDKVLALTGGPDTVALWAQLQSVVELVSSVAGAGVLSGLTVMIAQARDPRDERKLLHDALRLGLGASLAVGLTAPVLAAWFTHGKIGPHLFLLAALTGLLAIVPATLNAYWLGKHQQPRMLVLALLTGTVLLLVAAGAWLGLPLSGLLLVQCGALLALGSVIWRHLRKLSRVSRDGGDDSFRGLAKFVPVGLAIGIMSPVSMLLVRGTLSDALSWSDVGFLQALWRSAEWVTATAAGVLSLVFLPRFSAAFGTAQFGREMTRAGMIVLSAAACLLLLIFFNQRALLATLYDARFAVSDETAALILLGCWVRIASWVFLFGLFAAHRTWLIVAGEAFSLPLYALLLWLSADGMTTERAAWLFLASYLVYAGFNVAALWYSLRNPAIAPQGANIE